MKTEIHSNQFLIISIYKDTNEFSISEHPKIHESYGQALAEAERLADKLPDRKFVVVAVARVAEAVVPTVRQIVKSNTI